MTSTEADNFISEVLQGYFPRWKPKQIEITGWKERLLSYDYNKAKRAVNNLFFGSESRGIDPPAGRILQALKAYAYTNAEKSKNEPVLLFTIVKESNIRQRSYKHPVTGETIEYTTYDGQKFSAPTPKEVPCREEIERQAENMRMKFNETYGGNHIVVYAQIEKEQPETVEVDDIPF